MMPMSPSLGRAGDLAYLRWFAGPADIAITVSPASYYPTSVRPMSFHSRVSRAGFSASLAPAWASSLHGRDVSFSAMVAVDRCMVLSNVPNKCVQFPCSLPRKRDASNLMPPMSRRFGCHVWRFSRALLFGQQGIRIKSPPSARAVDFTSMS